MIYILLFKFAPPISYYVEISSPYYVPAMLQKMMQTKLLQKTIAKVAIEDVEETTTGDQVICDVPRG
jgi:hypothetical protein